MTTLFISDLHLGKDYPHISILFQAFLEKKARHAKTLYILGDLFEVWLGDDASMAEHREVIDSLRKVSDAGTDVAFMHGNRDFLLGTDFCIATGARLLEDPSIITLNGEKTLLMHGDTLCTDDVEYQSFRKQVRNKQFQQEFLSLSIPERVATASRYRQMSKEKTSQKSSDIMDVNLDAVVTAMKSHNVSHLIHGHTHRPGKHIINLGNASCEQEGERLVLGDWYERGSMLVCDEQGQQLIEFDLTSL